MSDTQTNSYIDPKSPCINLCKMDDEDLYCLGCHRTLEEIANWSSLSIVDKDALLLALKKRPKKID